MSAINCLMVSLANPTFNQVGNGLVNRYFEYIDSKICVDNYTPKLYTTDPHVTLVWSDEPFLGPNESYVTLKIRYKELYEALRDSRKLILPSIEVKTFDNETDEGVKYRVLYLDVKGSNHHNTFESYNSRLTEDYKLKSNHTGYNPHITLTYLKGDTPDSVIEEIKEYLKGTRLTEFDILGFNISGKGEEAKLIELGG